MLLSLAAAAAALHYSQLHLFRTALDELGIVTGSRTPQPAPAMWRMKDDSREMGNAEARSQARDACSYRRGLNLELITSASIA